MFGFIVKKAQATVDNAIGQVVNGVIVAVPLFVAGGFGTAVLLRYLDRTYGTDAAYLILACGFGVLGLLALVAMNLRSRGGAAAVQIGDEAEDDAAGVASADGPSPIEQLGSMAKTDKELLMSALTATGPYALPGILRVVLRNLPLILAVLAAVFVMSRPDDGQTATGGPDGDGGPDLQPAE